MPIEEIQVGDRVWVDLPAGLEPEGADEDEVDPATWRKVSLRAVKVDGSSAEIELLRSVDWLIAQQATVGGVVEVAVPECGIDGPALVLAVEPCPPIRAGPGRVVTATFRHAAASLVDVHVDGLSRPIGATPNHPFWSEDRRAFVRADELALGERLRTLAGPAAVRALVPRPAPTPVYNIEVHADHVYHIADLGVLVHNAKKCTPVAGPYSHLKDSPTVGPGKDFTPAQKAKIIEANMARNGGVVKSDLSGKTLTAPKKSNKGVTPDLDEWQIDHINPKDNNGSNSYANAQVLSRAENRAKSNTITN